MILMLLPEGFGPEKMKLDLVRKLGPGCFRPDKVKMNLKSGTFWARQSETWFLGLGIGRFGPNKMKLDFKVGTGMFRVRQSETES